MEKISVSKGVFKGGGFKPPPPPRNLNVNEEIERKKGCWGRGLPLDIFLGSYFFEWGLDIFGKVEKFSWGIEKFSGGLSNFRGG